MKFVAKFYGAAVGVGAVAAVAALTMAAGAAQAAPEFSCRNAQRAAEVAICRSAHLSKLDTRMTGLYDELMGAYYSSRERSNLKNYQRAFLRTRDFCGFNENCIKGAYLDQISVLEERLNEAYGRDAN